jgi:tetratricopeptide (TPR) repeat protein
LLDSIQMAGQIGDIDYQLRSLWALATQQSFAGRHRAALANLDQFGALAERTNNRSVATALARFRHMIQFYHGDVVGAHEALTQLARQHHQLDVRPRISQADPYVVIRVSLAFVSWVRGDRLEAASIAQASVDGAKTIGHLISQVNALALAVIPIALWAQDLDVAERHVALLTDNLNQMDLANWAPFARFFAGAIAHQRGEVDAIDRMRAATDEILASNFLIRFPFYLGMLAEAALEQGATELARSSIADALAHAEDLEEAWCRPELLRILGLVEQRSGDKDRAEDLFLRAMQMAEEAGAFFFQFGAALELANCWVEAQRTTEAAALLDQVCKQVPGDTPGKDIARARALLQRLRNDLQ